MTVAAEKPAIALPSVPEALPLQYRSFQITEVKRHMVRAANGGENDLVEEPGAFDITISTETPVDCGDYFEVLGHGPDEVDLTYASRGITFMLEHGGGQRPFFLDPKYRAGIVEDLALGNGELTGTVRFAADAALAEDPLRLKRDWESGEPTMLFISAGYVPQTYIALPPEGDFGKPTLRWSWQLRECSSVAVPADPQGMKSRSAEAELYPVTAKNQPKVRSQEVTTMPEPTTTTTPPAAQPAAAAPTVQVGADNLATRNAESAAIISLCAAQAQRLNDPQIAVRAGEFVAKGLTLADVKQVLFDELATRSAQTRTATPSSEALEGMKQTERQNYSMRKAILLGMQIRSGLRPEKSLELDVHNALITKRPQNALDHGGILIPFDLRSESEIVAAHEERMRVRTMDTKTAGKGAEWVGQQQMQLIEFLEAQTVLNRLGANLNSALTSALVYPRETGEPTVSFLGENPAAGVSATDTPTGQILSNPRQMVGKVVLSRMFLYMTNGLGEARVRYKLGSGTARALDRAGFTGSGVNSQPVGLYFLAGVQTVAMGSVAPTFSKICDMGGKVSDQNADGGRMGFFTTAEMAWRLRSTLEAPSVASPFIWGGPINDGLVAGYRAIGSTQVSRTLGTGADEHGFGYGNWEFCDANLWGGLEIVVDEVTQGDSALVVLRSYGQGDVIFTHPEAFVIGTAAKLA